MANTLIGNIEPFVPGGNFKAYVERIEQLFIVNNVTELRKVPLFITICGADVYEILSSLASPKTPSQLSYSEITEKLNTHFKPQVNKRAERYKFYKITQEAGETISDFVIRLKAAAKTCEFGDYLEGDGTEFVVHALEDALIDRFIAGLSNEKIQQKLLNQTEANFEKMVSVATTMDVTQKEVRAMKPLSQLSVESAETYAVKQGPNKKFDACRRCGRRHDEKNCPAVNWQCFSCSKRGHTSRVCRSNNNNSGKSESKNNGKAHGNNNNNNQPNRNKVNAVYHVDTQENHEGRTFVIKSLSEDSPALTKTIKINGIAVAMEVDTGAVLAIMSHREYKRKFIHFKLQICTYRLITVTGENIGVAGRIFVEVRGTTGVKKLELVITSDEHEYTPLLGRTWLDQLYPGWRENIFAQEININAIEGTKDQDGIVSMIKKDFPLILNKSKDQSMVNVEAELILMENAKPIFHAPYSVPFKLRDKVKNELEKLVNRGILIRVTHSLWATPIIPVPKPGDEIRICMDCKVTLNRVLQTEHYPLPNISDIFASLSFARVFCVIDLKGAYQQIVVSKKSQELLTINTIFGLFQYTRLPFGVKSAPSLFQLQMDRILAGIKNVFCYLDDIIIGGKDKKECMQTLLLVLQRLHEHHVQINIEKCSFLVDSVKYLGHILGNGEIRPNPEKVRAIVEAPAPRNVKELQAYLGLMNHYGRFIPNLSNELACLYNLIRNDIEFLWSVECEETFQNSKTFITNDSVLELYDPNKPIIVASDASPYGVGAQLSHEINGCEKPVMFASSSLTDAQKNYSQIHREALAIMFAVKKFHVYIYGNKFVLYTDQRALSEIFHPHKGTPGVAAARLQRWSIILSIYKYEIKHRSAAKMSHVDALSRLPLSENPKVETVDISFFQISGELINRNLIKKHTEEDDVLSKIYEFLLYGWPKKEEIDNVLLPYFKKERSLALDNGCIFYGNLIVIPSKLQNIVLQLLHENHIGIVKMKLIARSYVWWLTLQNDIESFAQNCEICQQTRSVPKEIVKTKWPQTSIPFERIHTDFFHLNGRNFLIVVDSFSKYVEIVMMKTTVTNAVIDKFQKFFTVFGLPTILVSDNGPPFNSNVFQKYCKMLGIDFMNSPPWHPPSNGLAERGVQTAKKCLIRFCLGKESDLSIQDKIDKYLLWSRNTPNIETGRSPTEIVFSFKPKVILDNINDFLYKHSAPDNSRKNIFNDKNNQVESKHNTQITQEIELNHKFKVGEKVFYRCHFKSWIKWIPATIKQLVSRLTYLIEVNNQIRYVQENQIRYPSNKDKHFVCFPNKTNDQGIDQAFQSPSIHNDNSIMEIPVEPNDNNIEDNVIDDNNNNNVVPNTRTRRNSEPLIRTPKRRRKRVQHYGNNIYDH